MLINPLTKENGPFGPSRLLSLLENEVTVLYQIFEKTVLK